jgi:hypothetical protein
VDDPMQIVEARVRELEDNAILRGQLKEAQRLMREMDRRYRAVVTDRDTQLRRQVEMWRLLRAVRDSRWFCLLPKWLKRSVREEAGNAN